MVSKQLHLRFKATCSNLSKTTLMIRSDVQFVMLLAAAQLKVIYIGQGTPHFKLCNQILTKDQESQLLVFKIKKTHNVKVKNIVAGFVLLSFKHFVLINFRCQHSTMKFKGNFFAAAVSIISSRIIISQFYHYLGRFSTLVCSVDCNINLSGKLN